MTDMKRQKSIKAAATISITLCALCISCTSDEQAVTSGEPIAFTATGIASPATRSTINGDWEDTSGKSVAVQIGSEVKKYTITPSGDNTTASIDAAIGITPFYWNSSTETKTVTAWYPYSASDPISSWAVNADQSTDDNYIASDLLKASQEITYGNTALEFTHQVAKITVKVNISNLPSTATLTGATLKGVSGVKDEATAITMHPTTTATTYEAIVMPQSPTSATVVLAIDGIGNYTYTFENVNWEVANSYTYNLTVKGNEIELTGGVITPWNSETKEEDMTMTPNLSGYAGYTIKDVSTISGEVPDKTILTGTTTNGITIAAGATVVLYNINTSSTSTSAIKCNGDATIYLVGVNKATTTEYECCGIEVGPSGTTLTIDGNGSIEANATSFDFGAGIGSGGNSSCGNITINGGTVTATGGSCGAGIGSGGDYSSCGNITINGGTVTATGGFYGAGIGSGYYSSSCGNITINGGTVTATGGEYAAGIGSGEYHSSCGDITINGGTVTATGGRYAAGIGSGEGYSSCGDISISGNVTSVIATKGSNAPNSIGADGSSTCGTVTIEDETKVTQK